MFLCFYQSCQFTTSFIDFQRVNEKEFLEDKIE